MCKNTTAKKRKPHCRRTAKCTGCPGGRGALGLPKPLGEVDSQGDRSLPAAAQGPAAAHAHEVGHEAQEGRFVPTQQGQRRTAPRHARLLGTGWMENIVGRGGVTAMEIQKHNSNKAFLRVSFKAARQGTT